MKLQIMKVRRIKTARNLDGRKAPIVEGRDALTVLTHIEKGDLWLDLGKVAHAIREKRKKANIGGIVLIPFAHISNSLASDEDSRTVLVELGKILRGEGEAVMHDMFNVDKSLDISVGMGDPINFMEFNAPKIVHASVFYDKLGERFPEYMKSSGHYEVQFKVLEALKEYLEESVLDVGCGSGELVRAVLRLGHSKIIGNDLSRKALELARENSSGTTFTQEDAHELGSYENGSLGTILCCNLMYYLDRGKALDRWVELLMEKGRLIVMEEWPFVYPFEKILGEEFCTMLKRIVRPIGPKKLIKLIVSKGFELVEKTRVEIYGRHGLNGFVFEKK